MSNKRFVKCVVVPAGKWSLVESRGKGHLIKIGPFEEWVPKRVVELAEDGTLYLSAAFLTPGRLWTSVLRSYPTVKRLATEVGFGGPGGSGDGVDDDEMEIKVEIRRD